MLKNFAVLVADAWAYLTDPEARQLSGFKYTNGHPMSVRCAKQEGLM